MNEKKQGPRVQVRVTDEEHKLLRILASGRKCSVADLLRPCVEEAIKDALALEAALNNRRE